MRKSYYTGTVRGFVSGLLVEGGDNIYCPTPPNPDLSQLLISADRNIKVLREQITHKIGHSKLI